MVNMVWFHSYEVSRTDKFKETENKLEVTGAGGRGTRGVAV